MLAPNGGRCYGPVNLVTTHVLSPQSILLKQLGSPRWSLPQKRSGSAPWSGQICVPARADTEACCYVSCDSSNDRSLLSALPPARQQLLFDPELIENARHNKVDHVINGLGPVIEARTGRQNHRSHLAELQHMLQMDAGIGSLPRHQNQLAPLDRKSTRL